MDSLCRKASRCLLGLRVPLLMSLTLSLLQSRLPITIRGHGKTHGLSTQSFPERGEINGEAHGSPPSITRVSSEHDMGTRWKDNPRPNHPRHHPAPRAERLPRSPILYVPPSFPCMEKNTSSSHWIAVPGPGLARLSCRTLRLHLAPGLPHPPVRCFIPRRFPLLLLKHARTTLQRNKRRRKERSLVLVTFMQSKN